MLSVERYNLILELIKQKKNIKLNEIVEELKISEATARRDLNFLEEKKKIKRVHGGAVLVETKEEDIDYKKLINLEEKEIVAKSLGIHRRWTDYIFRCWKYNRGFNKISFKL